MAEPVLRWAGGKRQYLDIILHHIPPTTEFNTYFEPFFGGGSVYFALGPSDAHINDVNPCLTNFYNQLRVSPSHIISKNKELDKEFEALISQNQTRLTEFSNLPSEKDSKIAPANPKSVEEFKAEFYEQKREEYNNLRGPDGRCEDPLREAVLFLFLNRTCWNGLYRTNQAGEFNVPIGRQWTKTAFLENRIYEAQRILKSATITTGDFTSVLELVKKDDLVFLDPPYPAGPDKSSFQQYHPTGFDLERQHELATLAIKLSNKGAHVIITNEPSEEIMDIYSEVGVLDQFAIDRLEGSRMINSTSDQRTNIGETDLILTNYDPGESPATFGI